MKESTACHYFLIDQLVNKGQPFFLYRSPAEATTLALFRKEEAVPLASVSELNGKEGFVIAPFQADATHPLWLFTHPELYEGEEAILQGLSSLGLISDRHKMVARTTHLIHPVPFDEGLTTYQQAFKSLYQALNEGICQKVVLSRAVSYPRPPDFSPGHAFFQAAQKDPTSFVFLFFHPHTGIWLGSSPELLLKGDSNHWKTMALAGTQSVSSDQDSPEWDTKNRMEQQFVTDHVTNILHPMAISYKKTGPVTVRAGQLYHLKTEFEFTLSEDWQTGSILEQLHPTPAVCGYPTDKALELIYRYEGYDRAYYTGFCGPYHIQGNTSLYVTIRCLQLKETSLTLYAGGGLLPDSECASEWLETEAKLQTMLSLLTDASC
jgi:isochorismate synthase